MFGRSLRPHAHALRDSWMDGAFSPLLLRSFGLMVWYRADKGITLNGGNVSGVADQSGVGDANRNLSQATAANQPPYNATDASFNGQASIGLYNGTSHTLPATGVWSTAPPATGTMFAVFKTGAAGVEAITVDPNNGNNYEWYQNSSTTNMHFFLGGAVDTGGSVANMNNVHVYGADINAAGPTVAVSQDAITPAFSVAMNATTAATSLSIGRAGAFAGKWAEFILCNQRLPPAMFAQTMRYLGARYGIAIGS